MFNLDAYLARINYHDRRCANIGVLTDLHEAHAAAIPFENLDVLLGRPVRLDLPSLEAKLHTGPIVVTSLYDGPLAPPFRELERSFP